MKKHIITIQNIETGATRTLELEGYVLMGIQERTERGRKIALALETVSGDEVLSLVENLKEETPQLRNAELARELKDQLFSVLGSGLKGAVDEAEKRTGSKDPEVIFNELKKMAAEANAEASDEDRERADSFAKMMTKMFSGASR